MKTIVQLLTLTTSIFFFLNSYHIQAQCHIDDWTALKAIYECCCLNWIPSEFAGDTPTDSCNLGDFYGVGLNDSGRVQYFIIEDLDASLFRSSIPTKLAKRSNLNSSVVVEKNISGNIPPEIGKLSNLTAS